MAKNIESHLIENRIFKPSTEFSKKARVGSMAEYKKMHAESVNKPDKFWAREAKELHWLKKWTKVLDWKLPYAKWFTGGKMNAAQNCLDRHLETPRANKAAIIWEGEPGDKKVLTYRQLHREVCKFANVLKRNGVKKGDRVLIYMPLIPEASIAMLACARIGAVHCVVFGGFSAESIKDRLADSGAKIVVTADGGYRRGQLVTLKQNVDHALKGNDSVKKVIVFRRSEVEIHIEEGRDVWWHREMEYVSADCPAEHLDSEHPLFILYTSGSTGRPKGVMLSHALQKPKAWLAPGLAQAMINTLAVGAVAAVLTVGTATFLVHGLRMSSRGLGRVVLPLTSLGYAAPGAVLAVGDEGVAPMLRRLVEDKRVLRAPVAGVAKAAVVQASTAYGHDSSYLADSLKAAPSRFTGVFSIDPLDPRALDHMDHWTSLGMTGMRVFTTGSAFASFFLGGAVLGWIVLPLVAATSPTFVSTSCRRSGTP